MKALFLIFTTMIGFSVLASAQTSQECPYEFGTDDYVLNVIQGIEAKATCDEASDLAVACGMGSGIDVEIADTARGVCEHNFIPKMTHQNTETYLQTLQLCEQKYKDQQGSIYVSAWSYCNLKVAQLFDRLFTSADE